ncbi:MAG TPA: methionine--tRNA ligase [Candidatus Eisenbacteria bacterium]|jgi:methionyl-tRNA synthetase|nr:methionine--tRNA ligase [Candidatus Eisenbacteria bacterium]
MAPSQPKYYLTTPIYYTNGLPHIGHVYTTIVCDTVRRFKRMRGFDVVMATGTDEHGVNVERAAQKAGVPESEFVARMAETWKALWEELGIPADEFIRTTDLSHVRTVQWLFRRCRENDYIYKGHYIGQYCIYDNAYVDVKPGENCPDCGRPTETVTEENYFFKLSAFQKPLLDFYKKNPNFIQPESRRNEIISFVEGGLKDLSITRATIRWGIPVPGEEPHVFYVWFDALTSYLTAVGGPEYERRGFWPADVHVVGKDIIRFHAVYWPAFLMAAMLPVPKQVWAHGWFLMDQAKMSKSKGNVVRAKPIVDVLGMDALRYFLLRDTVFGQDGNFSYDALVTRYNSELANGLGNLASRTAALIEKNFGGKISKPVSFAPEDEALAKLVQSAIGEILEAYENFSFSRALEQIWSIIAAADKYLTTEQPWALGDSDADKLRKAAVLYTTAELLRVVTALAHPALPQSTNRIWALLGQPGSADSQHLDGLRWGQLAPGTTLGKSQALFPRIDKAEALERIEAMQNEEQNAPLPVGGPAQTAKPAPAAAPIAAGAAAAAAPAPSEKIGIEDFAKVEMRVGQVKTAERIVGADKLLKLTVDIGTEVRQICAGIAQYYEPESLIGRKVVVVVNLAPRKLRGVESNGMIVAASVGPEGRPVLAGFAEDVEVGARLK